MKKMLLLLILIFWGIHYSESFAMGANETETFKLNEMAHMMETHNIQLKKWSLYTRGNLGLVSNYKGYQQVAEHLQKKWPGFEWTKISPAVEHWMVTGIAANRDGEKQRITLVAYPQKQQFEAYFIYAVEGKGKSGQNWKAKEQAFRSEIRQHFSENAQIFACVSGSLDAKMKFGLYKKASELVASFSAVPVEQVKEETFVAISAYTKHWDETILTGPKQMNLQLALRTDGLGGRTTVTIGTPIITSEY